MKTVPFSALHQMDYKISRVVPAYQYRQNGDEYVMENRPGNGFLILTNCHMQAFMEGHPTLEADSGDICYTPQGSYYVTRYSHCPAIVDGKPSATNILINFTLEDEEGEAFRLSDHVLHLGRSGSAYYTGMFAHVAEISAKGSIPLGRVKALLYNLLTDLSTEIHREGFRTQSYASIYPAIEYIDQNYISNPPISEMAKMCAMSEPSLRRLFKQYAGISPLGYILQLKISRAQLLLEVGGFSIAQVAEASGFEDAAYFSRIFKKKTGLAPSEVLKK